MNNAKNEVKTMTYILELGCGNKHKYLLNKKHYCFDCDKSLNCINITHADFNDNEKLPYPNNYFDKVYASHFMEHLVRVEKLLSEVRRVLKIGGTFEIIVPHHSNIGAWWDITHKHCFSYLSFDNWHDPYYMNGWELVSKNYQNLVWRKWYVRLNVYLCNILGKWADFYLPFLLRHANIHFILKKKELKP